MDKALESLSDRGILGALLVLALGAIVFLWNGWRSEIKSTWRHFEAPRKRWTPRRAPLWRRRKPRGQLQQQQGSFQSLVSAVQSLITMVASGRGYSGAMPAVRPRQQQEPPVKCWVRGLIPGTPMGNKGGFGQTPWETRREALANLLSQKTR